jgi:hypothetical protein
VTRFEDELVGYKLGLTWGTVFNATEPVYGRLFRSMLRENNSSIYLSDFVKPMLELEIAYIFGEDVSYPVTLEDLQAAVLALPDTSGLPIVLGKKQLRRHYQDLPGQWIEPWKKDNSY